MSSKNSIAPLITYEGIEGAGKSTQMQEVAKHFKNKSLEVLVTREPGGTSIAEKIRQILIHPENENLDPKSELYLMQAARVQHVRQVIEPAQASHDLILCDRFIDSSTAYQGAGRDLGIKWVEKLNMFSTHGLLPRLTFFIDIPVELSLERMRDRNQKNNHRNSDRFEREKVTFYQTIRSAYINIANSNPDRIIQLDGTQSKTELIDQQIQKIQEVLG